MRHTFLLGLVTLSLAAPAMAHDFWLQPGHFTVAPGAQVPMTIQVGHGRDRTRWSGSLERVVEFVDVTLRGRVDLRNTLQQSRERDAAVPFTTAGAHVLGFRSTHAASVLPAIRFNAYLQAEGLTPALVLRARTKKTDTPGKEIYSRCAKTIVQVGRVSARDLALVTSPIGLPLEIVPERNPYSLRAGESLPVKVVYQGRALAGATVMLTSLEFDARPVETHLTDAGGRATFKVPRVGTWLINVLWTSPVTGNPDADFDTTFSSLTFGFVGAVAP